MNLENLKKYNKLWVSMAAPLGVLLYCLSPSDTQAAFVLTKDELYLVVVAIASTAGVYAVPNKK
jgi:hypothetical protein